MKSFKEFLTERKLASSAGLNLQYFKLIQKTLKSRSMNIEQEGQVIKIVYDNFTLGIRDNRIVGFSTDGVTFYDTGSLKSVKDIIALSKMPGKKKEIDLQKAKGAETPKYVVKDQEELEEIVKNADVNADLNYLDVSNVIRMGGLFKKSSFNGDISKWDVSNVIHMGSMFANSSFNGDISKWDVSNVNSTAFMFENSSFNGDISKWNVSNVTDMNSMFRDSAFNGDISKWDVSKVTTMHSTFKGSAFNGDISKWDVSKVTSSGDIFKGSAFNGDISKWNLSDRAKKDIEFDLLNK